jgi:hypothetical protein
MCFSQDVFEAQPKAAGKQENVHHFEQAFLYEREFPLRVTQHNACTGFFVVLFASYFSL